MTDPAAPTVRHAGPRGEVVSQSAAPPPPPTREAPARPPDREQSERRAGAGEADSAVLGADEPVLLDPQLRGRRVHGGLLLRHPPGAAAAHRRRRSRRHRGAQRRDLRHRGRHRVLDRLRRDGGRAARADHAAGVVHEQAPAHPLVAAGDLGGAGHPAAAVNGMGGDR